MYIVKKLNGQGDWIYLVADSQWTRDSKYAKKFSSEGAATYAADPNGIYELQTEIV
jgi:hypothetical protein